MADEAIMDEIDNEVIAFLAETDAIIAALDKAMPALAQPQTEALIGGLTDADFAGLL